MILTNLIAQAPSLDEAVGKINPPPGVQKQIDKAVSSGAISAGDNALFFFLSNMVRVGMVIMAIWVIFNFLLAGYDFINGKDNASAQQKARDRLTMSVIGLLILMAAYAVTGVISAVFFGDAGFVFNPKF